MWGLDRLSIHSTPAASPPPSTLLQQQQQQRPYSPLPRRSHLIPAASSRPGLDSRSSSLSLISNSSSTNVPAAGRALNGSGLKKQIYSSVPEEVTDPLEALAKIIQTSPDRNGSITDLDDADTLKKPDQLVQDIDFGTLSLEDFAAQAFHDVAGEAAAVQASSEPFVDEYEKERDKFEDLHRSINSCDDVLKSVETYLSSFQTDLGAVSAEIETLQSRSTALNSKLENRKKVEKFLGPLVDQISISPTIVKKISEGPMDDEWVAALEELQARTADVERKLDENTGTKALDDLKPLLENLSNKAVERARDFFASQIKAMRSPNINAQIIQQNGFAKHRIAYTFLASKQPELAEDICRAYLNTMRWYYFTHFTRYNGALAKLKLYSTTASDVLGEETSISNRVKTATSVPLPDPFNIARRADGLKSLANIAMPSHAAEESKAFHYIETPFLAMNMALVDNISFEYTFFMKFFSPLRASHSHTHTLHQRLHNMLSPTTSLAHELTTSLISNTYDAIGILLCIRLTQRFAFILQRRKIPALESYINSTNMMLWPRFQVLLDGHCESLRRVTTSLPSRNTGAASHAIASMSGGSGSSSNSTLSGVSTAPHPITQRFANFVHAILALSNEAGDDEPVSNSLMRLRSEFESFLAKMGNQFGAGDRGKRDRERFLKNNYSLILTILADTRGRLADDVKEHFESMREGMHALSGSS